MMGEHEIRDTSNTNPELLSLAPATKRRKSQNELEGTS